MNDTSFTDYQLAASKTAIYPSAGEGTMDALVYTTLGLTNEAGEVAGKLKKVLRDGNGELSLESVKGLAAEIGDVLWYMANLASELGFSLEEIAEANLDKLNSRKERGVLGGSGDNR